MRWFQVAVSFFMKQHCSQHVDRQGRGNSHSQPRPTVAALTRWLGSAPGPVQGQLLVAPGVEDGLHGWCGLSGGQAFAGCSFPVSGFQNAAS